MPWRYPGNYSFLYDSKSRGTPSAHSHLEEELIAMMASQRVDERTKAVARSVILEQLSEIEGGSIVAEDLRDARSQLHLDGMTMKLFRTSLWHLATGDRDPDKKPRIKWGKPGIRDRDHRVLVTLL